MLCQKNAMFEMAIIAAVLIGNRQSTLKSPKLYNFFWDFLSKFMMAILHLSFLECAHILTFQKIDTEPSKTEYFFIDDLMTNQLTLDILIKCIVVIIPEFIRL